MRQVLPCLVSCVIFLAAFGAGAAPRPTTPDVVLGEWCSDYTASRKYAEDKGIPIIVVWGMPGCPYCGTFDTALASSTFTQWQQKRQLVMLYAKDTDTTDASRTKTWVKSGKDSDTGQMVTLKYYPFAMVYWKKGGKILAEKRFTGRSGQMPVKSGTLEKQFIDSIEKYIADYTSEPFPERDAWDPADDTRAGATVLSLSREALSHGPHYLNNTDTNDWFRLSALAAGSTNLVWVSGLFVDGAADLNARFYVGAATTPTYTVTLTSLASTPYRLIVPRGTGTPQDVYVLISRRPNAAATVRYNLHAREYIPRAIGFAASAVTAAEPAKGKTATLAIPVTRVGDDAAVSASVNVQFTDGTAKRGVNYDCSTTRLSWTASGANTQTLNVTLRGDGQWTGDQTFTITLSSPTAGFALVPFGTLTVTIRESNAYSAAKLSFAAVETPALGKKTAFTSKLNLAVREGDNVTVWLSCTGGNAMRVSADMKWSLPDWPAPASLTWLNGDRAEKTVTFTVPTRAGFQRPQAATLSIASAFGATLVSGKAALPFTVYDTIYAAPLTDFVAKNPKLPLRTANDDWFVGVGGVLRSAPLPEGGGAAVMTATLAGPGILRFAAGGEGALTFSIGGKPVPVPADGLAHDYLIPGGRQTVTWTASGGDGAYATLREMTFAPLPAETLGTFNGWATVTNGAHVAHGLATMTVSKAGKITGKLTLPGKVFSFSAPGYGTLADGALMVTNGLSATFKKEPPIPLTLCVTTNAPGVASLTSADGAVTAHLNRNGWSDKTLTPERGAALRLALNNPAGSLSKAPAGYYTLHLPATDEAAEVGLAGTGYLTLTLDRKGKTKIAGRLADGTSVSMSGVLMLDELDKPYMMLFTAPRAYSGGAFFASVSVYVSGGMRLSGDALWESKNPKATAVLGDGFSLLLPVAGGWYAKAGTLRQMYTGRDGLTAETTDTQVHFGFNAKGTGLNAVTCDEDNPMCLKVSLKSATGLFTGSFREPAPDGKKDVTRKLFGVLAQDPDNADFTGAGFYLIPQTVPYKHTQSEAFLMK